MDESAKRLRSDLLSEVGKRVTWCRERTSPRLSQSKLAARVGISRAAVSAIEAGHQGVSVLTLCQLAAALGVDAGDLLPDAKQVAALQAEAEHTPAEVIVDEFLSRHE